MKKVLLYVWRQLRVVDATCTDCDLPIGVENIVVGDINADTEWYGAVLICNVVIHLAARVHIIGESADDSLSEILSLL